MENMNLWNGAKKTEAAAFLCWWRATFDLWSNLSFFSATLTWFPFCFRAREVAYNSIMSCRRKPSVFIFTNYPPAFRNCLRQSYSRHNCTYVSISRRKKFLQKVFYHYPHTAQSKARLGFWGWLKGRFKDDFRNIFKSRLKWRLRIWFKDRSMGGS